MKNIIHTIKDFKIIPANFKSSGAFELLSADEENINAKLVLADERELSDYVVGSGVEVFGVNDVGLVYFETKITDRVDEKITLATTSDFSIIQRREYSRVGLNQGNITFKDIAPEVLQSVQDISAGGIKLTSGQPLEIDKEYAIEITLSNNMKIECCLMPIRIKETETDGKKSYVISGKFTNLENIDRIVLVQYAFKIKMEEQNKENEQ